MLCRLPAYEVPGFPSPTTNQTGSVIGSSREPRPFRTRSVRRRTGGRNGRRLGRRFGAGRASLVAGLLLARGGTLGPLAPGSLGLGGGLLLGLLALDANLGLGLGELLLDLLRGRRVGHVGDQVLLGDPHGR